MPAGPLQMQTLTPKPRAGEVMRTPTPTLTQWLDLAEEALVAGSFRPGITAPQILIPSALEKHDASLDQSQVDGQLLQARRLALTPPGRDTMINTLQSQTDYQLIPKIFS